MADVRHISTDRGPLMKQMCFVHSQRHHLLQVRHSIHMCLCHSKSMLQQFGAAGAGIHSHIEEVLNCNGVPVWEVELR